MPFQEKSLADVPARTPDVQIFFHGQLLLRSPEDPGRTCEVAVNPLATNHVSTIEARTKRPRHPDTIIMRHVGPLAFRRDGRESMLIEILNSPVPPAAFKCMEVGTPIDYTSGLSVPPDEDFRWILNLEGPQFHEGSLDVPIFDSHHIVKLQGGEFFFRTVERAIERIGHKRRGGGKGPVTFRNIGVIASASVFFADDQPNQSVKLTWQSPTRQGNATVVFFKEDDTTHEIYINNTPLYLDEPEDPVGTDLPGFDELPDFYKLVREVPVDEEFQLIPTVLTPSIPRLQKGSPSIPCQVHRLDGNTD